jgi:hypothetical protein
MPNINTKACFRTFGITFGCVPTVFQRNVYYAPNEPVDLSREFLLENGKEAEYYVKENGKLVETVMFSEPGIYPIELYVDYYGKITKVEKTINIGDSIPPVVTQTQIPKVKVNDVIVFADYLSITDNEDPEPRIQTNPSIVATEEGNFVTLVVVVDNHNNATYLDFEYEVIA